MDTSSISFTALYTGQVWYENGLSAPFFSTPRGRLMYLGMQPLEWMSEKAFGTNLHHLLLQRHHIMDYRIAELIEQGATQVLEIACGLSPRGHLFTRRFPELHYIEADLPDMAARKKALLDEKNAYGPHHKVIPCNILESGAPHGLDYILRNVLDPAKPTVVITEGLVNYFSLQAITPFWKTLAEIGKEFPNLWYFADCYPLEKGTKTYNFIMGSMKALGTITRAEVNPLFSSDQHAIGYLNDIGFGEVKVHEPETFYTQLNIPKSRNKTFTRVIEAKV
ncbi:MAG: class I SAM-dependent methyltransferase [Pseudomonadales bacterium]|nr:class I SAM-dependent methyltransferase [Pseudomonadales bacterium]